MNIIKQVIKAEVLKALKACLSKDITSAVLNYIHVGPDYIESTDGKILMRWNCTREELPAEGVYKIIAESKLGKYAGVEVTLEKMEFEFPKTDQVIPKKKYESIGVKLDDALSFTSAIIGVYEHTGNAVSYELIEKLARGADYWNVYANGKEKPVTFKAGDFMAIVMPYTYKKALLIVEEKLEQESEAAAV